MSSLYCPKCNMNVSGKFCTECGSATQAQVETLACTKCGVVASGKFCVECGGATVPAWRLRNASDQNARPDAARHATTSTWDAHYGNPGNSIDTSSQLQGSAGGFGNTDAEKTATEEARVSAHVERSLGREKKVVSEKSYGTDWVIELINLPQDRGMPVSLSIRDQPVYKSDGINDKDVSAKVEFPITENYGGDYAFNLKIPVMGADINKSFSSNEGRFVKMEFTPRGLSVAQATGPNAFH